ncbi:unnamed protein product [Didymodactylos carnosus]|uniref:HAT C-terminal dimerisation domain-containing protein n=1 Tax=Didymodactylos carnosus TaxID=1234261 RepID=A0A815K945_9BILA|nr:unnamed protein product [Didymodactylos carnosus]CAF4286902.1 unnamed protein product [Didymodactylos carnosus]
MNEDETSSEEEDLRKNEASSEKEGLSEKNQANDNEESSEIEDLERRHEYELPTKINNLLLGLSMDSTPLMETDEKILSVREELANYVSRVKQDSKFETFWSENNNDLKCLASLVRRYSVIPASSVASERV